MNLFISSCFSLLLVFVINVLCYQEESDGYHYQKAYPQDVMVDVINNFGLQLLKAHNEGNNNNMALSPYGATSVLIALGEGVRGYAVEEIQHAVHIPQDISVVRIGLRDIHRHLKSYFIPKEGFLAGLTLSNEKVPLNEEYKEILRFYGFDLDSFNNPLYPDINEVTTSGMVFMGNATDGVMPTTGYTTTFLPTATTTMVEEGVTILSSSLTTTSRPSESTITPEGTTQEGTPQEGTTTEKSTTKVYTRSTDAVSKNMVEDELSTLPISTQSFMETTSPPVMVTEDSTMKESTDSQTTQATTERLSSSKTTTVTTSEVMKESAENPTTTEPGSTSPPKNEVESTTTKLTTIQATTAGLSSSISTTEVTTSKVMKELSDNPTTTELGSTRSPENEEETTPIKLTTIQATTEGQSSSMGTTEQSTTSKVMKESIGSPTTTEQGSTNSPEKGVEPTNIKLTTIQATTVGQSSSITTTEEPTTSKVMNESTDSPTTIELRSTSSSAENEVETTTTKLTTIQATTDGSSSSISTTEDNTTSKVTTSLPTTENIPSLGTDTTSLIPSTTEEMEDMSTTSSSESSSDSSSSSSSSSSSDDVIITTSVTRSVTRVTTEYQTSTSEDDKVTSTVQTTELDDSSDLIAISTEATSNEVVDFLTSTIAPDTTTIASTEVPENTTVASSKRKRTSRSVIDYIIARYYDNQLIGNPKINYEPNDNVSFLMYGKIKEPNINFMTYDAVLPIAYIPVLNSVALSFPLDSKEYYLLLILPVDETGIDRLIHDMSHTTSLRDVITALRYAHVRAVIPSFMLKGYVILTPTLQKLGIQRIFEPRQTDFSLMTREKDVYVTNVEQAVTVTIRNYVEPDNLPNYRNLQRAPPVEFKADHPFLYFVMDTEIHVTLMAGKIVNPLNSRIR